MDTRIFVIPCICAVCAWVVAIPLGTICNQLLQRIPNSDWATTSAQLPQTETSTDSLSSLLVPHLSPVWRRILEASMSTVAAILSWRLLTGTYHTLHIATILFLTIATFAVVLIAILDIVAHLVFFEIWLPLGGMYLALGVWHGQQVLATMVAGGVVLGGVFLAMYLLGKLFYGQEALGFGDVQLAATFGVILGWPMGMSAIMLGIGIMCIVTLSLLLLRRITTQSYLPLGAFLAIGTIMMLLFAAPVWA